MSKQLPIFIINLKKDMKKKQHMEAVCEKHGLSYQFTEAIYGKELDEKSLANIYNKERVISELGRELTKGEIGCTLSHIKIYKQMIEQNIEKAIIFEDDIQIEDSFHSIIALSDIFPNDWELILLGYHRGTVKDKEAESSLWSRKKISDKHKLVRLIRKGLGTHGYLINKQGATKLIQELSMIKKPIDHYTGDDTHINVYAISPPIVKLDTVLKTQSNIRGERLQMQSKHNSKLSQKRELTHTLQREILRPFKRLLNNIKLRGDQLKFLKKYT